jgi:hypothetical protein
MKNNACINLEFVDVLNKFLNINLLKNIKKSEKLRGIDVELAGSFSTTIYEMNLDKIYRCLRRCNLKSESNSI